MASGTSHGYWEPPDSDVTERFDSYFRRAAAEADEPYSRSQAVLAALELRLEVYRAMERHGIDPAELSDREVRAAVRQGIIDSHGEG